MRVISKERGVFRDKIKILAEKYEECEFDSFLGCRRWWIHKGEAVIITVPASEMIEVGDFIRFPYCVYRDWKLIGGHNIRWCWVQ